MSEPVAVYVHIPFCPSKCGYCDFNSYAMDGEIVERTSLAIAQEIRNSHQKGRAAKTIFFGGGTPTFLEPRQLEHILNAVLETHPPIANCEITSEANPGTVDASKFAAMRSMGFNRVSLGAQSFDTGDLMRLGRIHEPSHIARAVGAARQAGFDNLNLDLMFALPGQSPKAWEHNLKTAIALHPDHLSLYCLTIEPNTRFYRLNTRGMLDLPDDEGQVEMYDMACRLCQEAGYDFYEISNFAKTGKECRHNLCYWRGEDYLGYGPGAVGCSHLDGQRIRATNTKHPQRYCELVESNRPVWCESEVLSSADQRLERVMLGVRLAEGLRADDVLLDAGIVQSLVANGWVTEDSGRICLTPLGRHYCSEVVLALA